MKTTIILLAVFAFVLEANAQKVNEADVPEAVKTKFVAMFPGVKTDGWEKENGKYEAEFKQNKIETSVLFESNGTYVQTDVEIPVSELPKGVNDYATKNLAGKKINEATKITSADGTLTYEAEIGNIDYLFDAGGNFLKKDSDSGDTEDDDKKLR